MNLSLMSLEIAVVLLGLALLLVDLWTPAARKPLLGLVAAAVLFLVWVFSFQIEIYDAQFAFGATYVMDPLALFFKRLFLLAAVLVLVLAYEFRDRIPSGLPELHALMLFALAGMMFAASANSFVMLFVSLELITVTFYILTAFARHNLFSLEAGVKYLVVGAMASAFMVFGIALVFGSSGTLAFPELAARMADATELVRQPVFQLGMLLVLAGLGFKIAAFPFQIWTPDVYQGAPTPVTAFLAVGSKAAGFVLLVRLLSGVVPGLAHAWQMLLVAIAAITILYGNLCAIPQRNLKRLMGYSSIAHAGYLLLGVAALSRAGDAAILFYLSQYVFTAVAVFTVLTLVFRELDGEDIGSLAGLHRRSPFAALVMTLSMASLAGIPPLSGFFGKFLLFKSALAGGADQPGLYALVAVAVVGVVISLYYYFGVVRAMYWQESTTDESPISISLPLKIILTACLFGMLYLGVLPSFPLWLAEHAVSSLSGGIP